MDDMEEASLLKNVTGGGGCGCGCLGMLCALVAALALAGIPLELYSESQLSSITIGSVGALVVGSLLLVVGGVMYVGSLFLE